MDTFLTNLYAGVLVAFGIGFVIFLHELGHFLAAKWAGVKVEKFAIGFGPVVFAFRKGIGFRIGSTGREYAASLDDPEAASKVGETEYSLRALPLGGFVGMLGEDASAGGDGVKTSDPRALPNRPVGARMVICAAGVVMNLILGFACYVVMYTMGVEDRSPVLGSILPGQPAYDAGFRPGDTIVAIDGHPNVSFNDLRMAVTLSGTGQKIRFDVKHYGSAVVVPIEVEPKRGAKSDAPTIGVLPGPSLSLYQDERIPGGLGSGKTTKSTIRALGPKGEPLQEVADIQALYKVLLRWRDRPLTVAIDRSPLWDKKGEVKHEEGTVPPRPFRDLGLELTAGPVAVIRPNSPAATAGFRVGDRIVSIGGKTRFDPMRLPDIAAESAGKTLALEVRRGAGGQSEETVMLTAIPDASPPWVDQYLETTPLEIPGLGLALSIVPKVAAVKPGSPAEKAGIKPGDVLATIRFSTSEKSEKTGKVDVKWAKKSIPLDDTGVAWPAVFENFQNADSPVRLGLAGRKDELELSPTPVEGWFDPMRGLGFVEMYQEIPPQPISEAIRRGARDTRETALSIYITLRSLFQRRLSPKAFVSPVKIADIAFSVAKYSEFSSFLRFLAMISINLAVVNFLPVPPLDGGQMTFLIAEKVRGRPLPDDAVKWPTLIGIALVLSLFAAVLIKDLWSYF